MLNKMSLPKILRRIYRMNIKCSSNVRQIHDPTYNFRNIRHILKTTDIPKRLLSTEGEEKPLVYSSSKAAQWKTKESIAGIALNDNPPPSQMYVVLASVTIFLIYFCVLREENDIDLELSKHLGEHVEGLDESTIRK